MVQCTYIEFHRRFLQIKFIAAVFRNCNIPSVTFAAKYYFDFKKDHFFSLVTGIYLPNQMYDLLACILYINTKIHAIYSNSYIV